MWEGGCEWLCRARWWRAVQGDIVLPLLLSRVPCSLDCLKTPYPPPAISWVCAFPCWLCLWYITLLCRWLRHKWDLAVWLNGEAFPFCIQGYVFHLYCKKNKKTKNQKGGVGAHCGMTTIPDIWYLHGAFMETVHRDYPRLCFVLQGPSLVKAELVQTEEAACCLTSHSHSESLLSSSWPLTPHPQPPAPSAGMIGVPTCGPSWTFSVVSTWAAAG